MEYELVPKGQHRWNIAEKVIQTWKAHAIGVFSDMDTKCPLFLWDLMLKQVDMQVNMLSNQILRQKPVHTLTYMDYTISFTTH